jgi:hypothetical protein
MRCRQQAYGYETCHILCPRHSSESDSFEVDGANSARAILRQRNVSEQEIDTVWTAIALHTTPGIPQHMYPVVALLTTVLRWTFSESPTRNFPVLIAKLSLPHIPALST